jgi:prophage regulatory protein
MLLQKKEVCALVGYSGEHIRRLVRDGLFPKPVILNANPNAGWSRKAWLQSEVDAWLACRVAARDAAVTLENEKRLSERASARAQMRHRDVQQV